MKLTKINLYGQKITKEFEIGDFVIRKDNGKVYKFDGITKNGLIALYDGSCGSATSVDNLRW